MDKSFIAELTSCAGPYLITSTWRIEGWTTTVAEGAEIVYSEATPGDVAAVIERHRELRREYEDAKKTPYAD